MAVGTDHFALLDLIENAMPVPVGKRLPDAEQLVVAEVIELEDDRVPLATVNAWIDLEELEQVPGPS